MSADKLQNMDLTVRRWHELMVGIEAVLAAMQQSVGLNPEAPLPEAIWALAGGYQDALDADYNIGGWLDWWWHECDLGERPKQAKLAGDSQWRDINTIDDLVQLLRDEMKLEEL